MRVPATYYPRESPVHRIDARVKLALLVVYTVCLFIAVTWRAMGVLVLILAVALVLSRLPMGMLARMLVPVYVLMIVAVVCNTFTPNPEAAAAYGLAGASAGVFEGAAPLAIAWGWYLLPSGLAKALFYCVRVIAMVLASLLVAYSTPATQLTSAFAWMLRPLARLRVPVDDIAVTFTLVLRFIPLAFEELHHLRVAQAARGAMFDAGGLARRVKAWVPVIVPWLVSLYRRAGRIATAMDVRAYGLAPEGSRSALNSLRMRVADWVILPLCLVAFIVPCLVFA